MAATTNNPEITHHAVYIRSEETSKSRTEIKRGTEENASPIKSDYYDLLICLII